MRCVIRLSAGSILFKQQGPGKGRTLYLLSKVFQLLVSVNMTLTPYCDAWSSTKSSPLKAVSLYSPAAEIQLLG